MATAPVLNKTTDGTIAQVIGAAMRLAVSGDLGRVYTAGASVRGLAVAGKSGTAELDGGKSPHSWFIGFAPYDDPQVAIAVLVEGSGGGGIKTEAPLTVIDSEVSGNNVARFGGNPGSGGGGILVDMFCHWRYVLDNLFGPVRSVSALGAIHIPQRTDEQGDPYAVTAEDAAYATFEIEDGPIVQMNSSWCVRVDRDELFELQVDGTEGSAVAGLRECRIQPGGATPMPVWNPDIPSPIDHRAAWQRVPDRGEHDNGFKIQWERFLRHVAFDEPFPWDFLEAAKGIQLAELGMASWEQRRFVEVPELTL